MGQIHGVWETSGSRKGFKFSSKGVFLGLHQLKHSQHKGTPYQPIMSGEGAPTTGRGGERKLLGLGISPQGGGPLELHKTVQLTSPVQSLLLMGNQILL